MKHTIRVCGKNASKRYPALCVQNKITIHRREETCIPSNRGIQRQAPTTIALPLSCSLRSLPHNGGLQGRFGEGGGKGKGEVEQESAFGHNWVSDLDMPWALCPLGITDFRVLDLIGVSGLWTFQDHVKHLDSWQVICFCSVSCPPFNVPGLDLHMSFSQSSGCEGYEPRVRVTLPQVLLEYSYLSDLYLEQTIRKRSLKLVKDTESSAHSPV